jgi:thiamine biosynthesis lipoprotein
MWRFGLPTRRPGKYTVSWNGRDDYGKQLPKGQYKLYAEVARENGGHEKISMTVELGDQKQSIHIKGKEEIDSLTFKSSFQKINHDEYALHIFNSRIENNLLIKH